jgi:hypothetical protein
MVDITYPPMYRFRSPGTLSMSAIIGGVRFSEVSRTPEMKVWRSTVSVEARVVGGARERERV